MLHSRTMKGLTGLGLWLAGAGENMNASQFYFTLDAHLDSLDEKHTIFGEVLNAPSCHTPAAVP